MKDKQDGTSWSICSPLPRYMIPAPQLHQVDTPLNNFRKDILIFVLLLLPVLRCSRLLFVFGLHVQPHGAHRKPQAVFEFFVERHQ
jgi:hypothetical protein